MVVALFDMLQAGAADGPLDPGDPPGYPPAPLMVAAADAARRLAHPLRSGSGRARLLPHRGQGCGLISPR